MSLVRLRTFVEVYRQLSISGAARALNLTQPAVSQHIAGLEVAVGSKLFDRKVGGLLPTSIAEHLAADIGDTLDKAEAAFSAARGHSIDVSGSIQIIGHADFVSEMVMGQLPELLEAGIRINIHAGTCDLIAQMLVDGQCDLGISAFGIMDGRLNSQVIFSSRTLAVASPEVVRRIRQGKSLSSALEREHLLSYNLELPLIGAWLTKNKIDIENFRPALVSKDLRALCNFIIKGAGWTVLPEYLCRKHIESGCLVEIPAPFGTAELSYHLLWAKVGLRKPRVAHAKKTILSRLKEL